MRIAFKNGSRTSVLLGSPRTIQQPELQSWEKGGVLLYVDARVSVHATR